MKRIDSVSFICKGPAGGDAEEFSKYQLRLNEDFVKEWTQHGRWNRTKSNPRFKVTVTVEFLDFDMLRKGKNEFTRNPPA